MEWEEKKRNLVSNFQKYINIYDNYYRVNDERLIFYQQILDSHKKHTLKYLLKNEQFLKLVYSTLILWNIGSRGSHIRRFPDFRHSVVKLEPYFISLTKYNLKTLSGIETIEIPLSHIYKSIKVVSDNFKLVGNSKALHFLLPDLIMPIDNSFTKPFCGFNRSNIDHGWPCFKDIIKKFIEIREILPKKYIGKAKYPLPKLIDNAIMGYKHSKINKRKYKEIAYIYEYDSTGKRSDGQFI